MKYATLLELIDDQLKPYGLEIVQVANVGGTAYWFIKVAGQETHAPGRFMDWNEGTLEITTSFRNRVVAAVRSAMGWVLRRTDEATQ